LPILALNWIESIATQDQTDELAFDADGVLVLVLSDVSCCVKSKLYLVLEGRFKVSGRERLLP
jgi:hypothetical protein